MHPNHEYVLNYIRSNHSAGAKYLDFGCGQGEVVHKGRRMGVDIYGAEKFIDGHNSMEVISRFGYLGTVVKYVIDEKIDFPSEYFDVIVNNQVFEYVENLDEVLYELHRVLKPDGKVLCLFPSKEVWSDLGVPILHRFSKDSKFRYKYLWLWGMITFKWRYGYQKMIDLMNNYFIDIDDRMHYRNKEEIMYLFRKHFRKIENLEVDYFMFRLKKINAECYKIVKPLSHIRMFHSLITWFVRKKGGMVISATK